MRIVFVGASQLGYRCCARIIELGFDVVGILTGERQFQISYARGKPVTNVLFADFGDFQRAHSIPVYVSSGKLSDWRESLGALKPDLLVVVGWYHMIPQSIRQLAPMGCIGLHASLLPKFRGNAPLVWSIIEGEKQTGLSLFYLEDGVDCGDIIAQQPLTIEDDDNIGSMLVKVEQAALEMLPRELARFAEGTVESWPQDESQATYFPARSPADGEIDWTWEPARIRNFIRAQSRPYPGAFTYQAGKKVIIWDADVLDGAPFPSSQSEPR